MRQMSRRWASGGAPRRNSPGLVFIKGVSHDLGLNLMHLYWTFKDKFWPSHFENTGPGQRTIKNCYQRPTLQRE